MQASGTGNNMSYQGLQQFSLPTNGIDGFIHSVRDTIIAENNPNGPPSPNASPVVVSPAPSASPVFSNGLNLGAPREQRSLPDSSQSPLDRAKNMAVDGFNAVRNFVLPDAQPSAPVQSSGLNLAAPRPGSHSGF